MTVYIDRTGEPDDVFEREVLARVGDPVTAAQPDAFGRQGDGPFCEETWRLPHGQLLVCQRGPRHRDPTDGRPHKDVTGLHWSDKERAAGVLR